MSDNPFTRLASRWHAPPGNVVVPVLFGSGVDLAVFAILFYGMDLPLLGANSLAYGLAAFAATGLAWHQSAGGGDEPLTFEVLLFLGVNLCGLSITVLMLWLAAAMVPVLGAKLLALGATTVWNYLGAAKFLPDR